jgi:single-stranded-DNA-specific exonuclease
MWAMDMYTWLGPEPVIVPDGLAQSVGGHPLVSQVLVRRGINDPHAARSFLDPQSYSPASPRELPGLEEAVERLQRAILRQEMICVWGDFDVDGQTATSLLVSVLSDLGARVSYYIPIRKNESHGVHLFRLKSLLDGGVNLVLTCDTGISAHEAIHYANSRGVDVLVTDHHELPESLPAARAVINPKLLPGDHPLATLPGVGVAYKLAESLYARAGQPSTGDSLLDLVALGIVADVALQKGDARYLLQRGLEVLRQGQRLGLQAMLALCELSPERLTEEHIAFQLGPRLNALGRLADANKAVEFLTTQDLSRVRILALELESLNARRRLLTDQVFQAAQAQIDRDPSLLEPAALVLWHSAWPAGVIGIVASRLVERFQRPVVLIACPAGELARGSARSVEGCNITAAIAAQRDLLASFGGHAMAAGLSMDANHLPEFRRRLSTAVSEQLGGVQFTPGLRIDGYLPCRDLSLQLVADLERLAPFGAGNPPLILVSTGMKLIKIHPIGRNEEHLNLLVEDDQGVSYNVLWWQGGTWPIPSFLEDGQPFDLAYKVRTSTFGGQFDLQVEWVDCRLAEAVQAIIHRKKRPISVDDYRRETQPLARLKQLCSREGELLIWGEGEAHQKLARQGVYSRGRHELHSAEAFAIWTSPAGPRELKAALEIVRPQRIFLFGINPEMNTFEPFIKRLAGLCKHIIRAGQGRTSLMALAAGTAHRQVTIRKGISWLEAGGFLSVFSEEDETIILSGAGDKADGDLPALTREIRSLLAETAAYRAYFAQVDKGRLVTFVEDGD